MEAATKRSSSPPESNRRHRKVGAIICDGEKLFGESLAEALSDHGAAVTVARDLSSALDALRAELPAHVVVAILPHGGDALDTLRRCEREAPGVRLFLVTSDPISALPFPGEPGKTTDAAVKPFAQTRLDTTRPLSELLATVLHGRPIGTAGQRRSPTLQQDAGEDAMATGASLLRFLTGRERQVLELLAAARSTADIADELGITVATTRGYMQSVLMKLGARTRVEAVAYLLRCSRNPRGQPCAAAVESVGDG